MTFETATEDNDIESLINRIADRVGSVWPLHSFVTANPLSGFESEPFEAAVAEGERLFGGRGYPRAAVFRRAWEDGHIDTAILREELETHGIERNLETLLETMDVVGAERGDTPDSPTQTLDYVLSKWLAAYLDQGQAPWPMPNREEGFYAAWRTVAPHDGDVPGCDGPEDLPATAHRAIKGVLEAYPRRRWDSVVEHHLAALPGWTGFIKQRTEGESDPWQSKYSITLTEYLAVRVTLADLLDASIEPKDDHKPENGDNTVREAWLSAWERSYREQLLETVEDSITASSHGDGERPAAQFVFCIDTRSEILRRHLEQQGPYETHGYAGFFGIPMQHEAYGSDVVAESCPPIVEPQHVIADRPDPHRAEMEAAHNRWHGLVDAARKHFKRLKRNPVAAFPFVEGAGSAYGSAMALRTLLPSAVFKLGSVVDEHVPSGHEFCTPTLEPPRMSHDEKVEYARTAFELMGWTEFARLVVFTGHTSHTSNNPFDSSLQCGACAGNPGGPNARVFAEICNDRDVKDDLRELRFDIPEDTVFLGAEHNTTTDEITLFDGTVPESHQTDATELREALGRARAGAAAERSETLTGGDPSDGVAETERRAADWAQTRPEWGLAGNASFVIGPRELTAGKDLDGRAFLHSYDWTTDPDGDALELIMQGPLVVTQWINNQYYFATVDNRVYGSGSKVTQNPVGNIGVVQGNGGDLMTGLPLQSLMIDDDSPYHQPLRLTAVIHAPVERVTEILREHDELRQLVDNGWIGNLTVIDPTRENAVLEYVGELEWEPPIQNASQGKIAPSAAD
jgi:uncharacterized protein YbcC (UPF0753/DUF2309 family)